MSEVQPPTPGVAPPTPGGYTSGSGASFSARQIVTERAARREQILVGVNARDLDTLQVVTGRLESLAGKLPPGVPHVAESGVSSGEDAAKLARVGYQLILVGSALMADDEPQALLREMLEAGRAAVGPR